MASEQRGQLPPTLQGVGLALGDDVNHPAASAVRLGTTEAFHVDFLARDRAHHFGSGDENSPFGRQHHYVS